MRIRTAGRVGTHDGFYWTQNAPSSGDIDSDNDGEMIPSPNFLIDLSHVGSIALGRQCSMMASYKLHSIRIGIRPVDDTIDNEEAAIFGGRFLNVLATDHAKTALQLARKTEKHLEGGQLDADSLFLSSEKDYSGFRYNWAGTAEDNVVAHATACTVPSMGDHWRIDEIFNLYNNMTAPSEQNALFNGRAPGTMQQIWECGWSNRPFGQIVTAITTPVAGQGGLMHAGDDKCDMHLDILPLVAGQVLYSSVNEPGAVDDDYYLWVEVDFTIGGSF